MARPVAESRLNGTWRQEGSQLIRTLMGCECADLSSRVGQFCRLSRERLDPRARKRDRRLNMPIKQSVYRLADEPRATILVRTSSATNAGTDKDSDKRQRTAITGVIGRRAVPLLLSQGHSVTAGVRQAARRAEPNAARRSVGSRVARAQSVMTTMPAGSPSASTVRSAALSMCTRGSLGGETSGRISPVASLTSTSRCIPMHSLPRE